MRSRSKKYIDSIRFLAQGGTGGNGFPKFGGLGGKGGDVILQAVEGHNMIKCNEQLVSRIAKADRGDHSRQFQIIGMPGKDFLIKAPVGVTISTDLGQKLGELNVDNDKIIVARGGIGGRPETQFIGQQGERRFIHLVLKLIADVGFVGFPNAGKSTMLKAISAANPKIASYPFTTIHPKVGMLKFPDQREIKMADLPGLIEGAWLNVGMGHKFLRHVERTNLLLFVVDINGFKLGPSYPHRSAIENVILLNRELELYKPELVEKPCLLVVNKMDLPGAEKKYKDFKDQLAAMEELSKSYPVEMQPERFVVFDDVIPCSAKTDQDSVEKVKWAVRKSLDKHDKKMEEREQLLEEAKENIKNQLVERHKKLM